MLSVICVKCPFTLCPFVCCRSKVIPGINKVQFICLFSCVILQRCSSRGNVKAIPETSFCIAVDFEVLDLCSFAEARLYSVSVSVFPVPLFATLAWPCLTAGKMLFKYCTVLHLSSLCHPFLKVPWCHVGVLLFLSGNKQFYPRALLVLQISLACHF